MAKRKIIKIDEEKCNGCGACIPNCPEGALQIIDNKARLLSDIFCDGLGACIGYCPQDAINIEERDAEEYSERKVMENIVKAGKNTIIAHLKHLKEHGEMRYYNEALEVLKEKGIEININEKTNDLCTHQSHSCPGARMMDFSGAEEKPVDESGSKSSQLRQWPVQLHLVPPNAPYFQGKDVLLVADCVAYAIADVHKDYLKGKSLATACPKLDSNLDIYLEKLTALTDEAKINILTVITMEVPCSRGSLQLAQQASEKASRKMPIKWIAVSIQGKILKEEWIERKEEISH